MNRDFETFKLKNIAKIFSGNSINENVKEKKYTNIDNGIDYISTKDIGFNSTVNYENGIKIPFDEVENFKRAPKNTVFICAEGGSAGRKVAISDRELCFVNKLFAVVAGDKVLPKYIFYFFKSIAFIDQFKASMTGIIGGVSLKKFAELEIKIPSLEQQQKIVVKLDAIFFEIDKTMARANANADNAEALFSSYLNKVFNSDFIEKKVSKLGDVCEFQGGSQPAKSYFEYESNEDNIRFIQIRDYKSDNNLVFIPKRLAKRFCDETEVMIGRYGPPVFQILRGLRGSYNVALMKAVPNDLVLTKDYLFYFLKNPKIQDYVISLSNRAAGQSGLNKETIEPYEIHIPSIDEQNEAIRRIEFCYEHTKKVINLSRSKIQNLTSLRQAILKQAFAGELVKD